MKNKIIWIREAKSTRETRRMTVELLNLEDYNPDQSNVNKILHISSVTNTNIRVVFYQRMLDVFREDDEKPPILLHLTSVC